MEFINARYLQDIHKDFVLSGTAVFGKDIDALLDSIWYNHTKKDNRREDRWKRLIH